MTISRLLIIIFIVINPSGLMGQQEESSATLQETLEWLKARLPEGGYSRSERDRELQVSSIETVSYKQCLLSWTVSWDQYRGDKDAAGNYPNLSQQQEVTYKVPLGAIEPLSFKITRDESSKPQVHELTFETTNRKDLIQVRRLRKISGEKDSETVVTDFRVHITAKDGDWALRLQRALKRAVKLCNGKVEPF